jgi:hypothetical protein
MFTLQQSRKVGLVLAASVVALVGLTLVYGSIFGFPEVAMLASIYFLPALILAGILSAMISSAIGSTSGLPVLGILVGILAGAGMMTGLALWFLRLIQELEDNMGAEEIENLSSYALQSFFEFGLPGSIGFYLVLWGFTFALNRRSA